MRFFLGLHVVAHAYRLGLPCCISINRLKTRTIPFRVGEWIMDSGAFTELHRHGHYRHTPQHYAMQIRRWSLNGKLLAAVAQDYMCEDFILARTGLSISDHQRLTIERYDALLAARPGCLIMPVLQGYEPADYVAHCRAYGARLGPQAWVGIGSVCKRNASPLAVLGVLEAVHSERPDLRLHGFGVKATSLDDARVRHQLWSADSMAWSWHARRQGRNGNAACEAARYASRIGREPAQLPLAWR